jgi:hypothetical protein
MSSIYAAFSSLLIALGATAINDSVAQQTPVAQAKNEQKQVICKSESVIGSRLKRKRTCLSREEWRLRAQQANDALNEVSRDR